MPADYLDYFYASVLRFLTENKLERDIEGVSEKEIKDYEQAKAIAFPKAYRLFLSVMGKSTLKSLDGRDFSISGLREAEEVSKELLEKDNRETGPDAFAFAQWQGYNFYYMTLGEDNPTVALYIEGGCEGDDSPPQIHPYGVFTDWLCTQLENGLRLRKQLNGPEIDDLLKELTQIKETTNRQMQEVTNEA